MKRGYAEVAIMASSKAFGKTQASRTFPLTRFADG